jgi:hypothetical protein
MVADPVRRDARRSEVPRFRKTRFCDARAHQRYLVLEVLVIEIHGNAPF